MAKVRQMDIYLYQSSERSSFSNSGKMADGYLGPLCTKFNYFSFSIPSLAPFRYLGTKKSLLFSTISSSSSCVMSTGNSMRCRCFSSSSSSQQYEPSLLVFSGSFLSFSIHKDWFFFLVNGEFCCNLLRF